MLMAHKLYDNFAVCDGLHDFAAESLADLAWLESAQHFDMGDVDALNQFKQFDGILRNLPYRNCWFECKAGDRRVGIYLSKMESGQTAGLFFTYYPQAYWMLMATLFVEADWDTHWITPTKYNLKGDDTRKTPDLYVSVLLSYVARFLSALRCVNVDKVNIDPPAAMQKARAKRGKKPFFSHWVLVLKGKGQNGEWLGGTHSSPRVHLRRSHFREYAPGKFTCVTECVVGNKKLGAVSKTYAFEPAMA